MYEENPLFDTPSDNTKIWRYLDFTKFIDLLDKSALFFAKLDTLGDPFEGICPLFAFDFLTTKTIEKLYKEQIKDFQKSYFTYVNQSTAVNCWHLNPTESAAMWKIYVKNGEGIAIQSTIKRLKNSIKHKDDEIYIGKVKYVNYEYLTSQVNPKKILAYPVIYKRKIFQHEKELRAVIQRHTEGANNSHSKSAFHDGIYVHVNLDTLINRVYVAPTSPVWQHRLLKSIIGKYKLNKNVIHSSLDDKPFFNEQEVTHALTTS